MFHPLDLLRLQAGSRKICKVQPAPESCQSEPWAIRTSETHNDAGHLRGEGGPHHACQCCGWPIPKSWSMKLQGHFRAVRLKQPSNVPFHCVGGNCRNPKLPWWPLVPSVPNQGGVTGDPKGTTAGWLRKPSRRSRRSIPVCGRSCATSVQVEERRDSDWEVKFSHGPSQPASFLQAGPIREFHLPPLEFLLTKHEPLGDLGWLVETVGWPQNPGESRNNDLRCSRCKNMIPESCERNWFLDGFLDGFWRSEQRFNFWLVLFGVSERRLLWELREKKGRLSKSGGCHPNFNGSPGNPWDHTPPKKKIKKRCFHDSRLHVRPSRVVYRSGGDPPNCF